MRKVKARGTEEGKERKGNKREREKEEDKKLIASRPSERCQIWP